MTVKQTWIAVEWDDAHGDTVMFDETEMAHKPYRFVTGGILIRSDAIGVSLAREIGEDGKYRDHAFIPRAMVVNEWPIGPVRKRWNRTKKRTLPASKSDSPLT